MGSVIRGSKLVAESADREVTGSVPTIRAELRQICSSSSFRASRRSRAFLEYVVEKTIAGRLDELKERMIGSSLFGRPVDYDTGADSIVRVVANETRRRLQSYYSQTEYNERVRIELCAGSYVPVFHCGSKAPDGQAASQHERPTAQLPSFVEPATLPMRALTGGRTWAAATLALAVLCVFFFVQNQTLRHRMDSAQMGSQVVLPQPWSSLFAENRGLHILLADTSVGGVQTLLHRQLPLADYVNGRYIPQEISIAPELDNFLRFLLRSHYTSAAYATTAVRIAQIAQISSVSVSVSFARDMSLRTFKSGANFVVLGTTRANPWAQLLDPQLNFSIEFNNHNGQPTLHNRAPLPGEQSIYVSGNVTGDGSPTTSYGHIAFLPAFYRGGHMLFVTGTDSAATEAAGELVTNQQRIRDALVKLGANPFGAAQGFEILLLVRETTGTPIRSDLIAGRLSPMPSNTH
jgi:hypothetical protein